MTGAFVAAAVVLAACSGDSETAETTTTIGTSASTSTSSTTTQPPLTTTNPTTTTTSTSTTTSTTTTTTTTTAVPVPTTTIVDNVVLWEPYTLTGPLIGIAALTGLPTDEATSNRPIVAAKIDNSRPARPQWGLERADAIIEENVEGVTRFVALFHSDLPPELGPVRSARTGDLDLFATMNRPVVVWSGGNPGVTRWVRSAASSGVLVDFTAQSNRCYRRSSNRRAPHNLLLDPVCATEMALGFDTPAGAAQPMWSIDGDWTPDDDMVVTPDVSFDVIMDGVRAGWTWDADSELYLRSQNGNAHVTASGDRIGVNTVVELYSFHARSPVDGRSPNPITIGGTRAVVHRDGLRIEGEWHRETAFDDFVFFEGSTGRVVPLDAGKTFIELARDR